MNAEGLNLLEEAADTLNLIAGAALTVRDILDESNIPGYKKENIHLEVYTELVDRIYAYLKTPVVEDVDETKFKE